LEIHPVGIVIAQIKQLQARHVSRLIKEQIGSHSLNGAQFNILYELWREDDITISELSYRTKLANTTLTTMLDRLEKMGYITRKSNPNDRREIRIILKEECEELKDQYSEISRIMQSVNFKGFTEEEEKQLRGYLDRIKHNLEEF